MTQTGLAARVIAVVLFFIYRVNSYFWRLIRDVAQPGSALRSGRRGRWFESSHPDKTIKPVLRKQNGLFV